MLHTTRPASFTPHVLQGYMLHTTRPASFTPQFLQTDCASHHTFCKPPFFTPHLRTPILLHTTRPVSFTPLDLEADFVSHHSSCKPAGFTPLVLNGRTGVTITLIENGGNVKSALSDGSTALSLAAEFGHDLIAMSLLVHEAEPNTAEKLQRWTPLHWAAHNGHELMVWLLLAFGAALEATTSDGSTALHLAARQGLANIARNLLRAGANIHTTNNDGWSPAHGAARYEQVEVLRVLLKMGADFDCLTLEGSTPLSIAAEYGALDAVRFILDIGAGESGKSHPQDWTPLHWAANEGELSVVRYLVCEGGFQPDLAPPDGTTALSLASEEGHIDTVLFLLDSGANPNATSGLECWTPLHWAACNGHQMDRQQPTWQRKAGIAPQLDFYYDRLAGQYCNKTTHLIMLRTYRYHPRRYLLPGLRLSHPPPLTCHAP
ncbi:hypothetical protein Purlil1_13975 [Purpureocillium lilacinum]|uniref:Uncharacterized protein n=1 Tax=Purpureocillium lilacinum TaxID=33203 RepID=A0ABR0BCJ6_PURLI|nr:hypothetical protein Purlil1_13975 [Purpureocillium lilacinum]